MSKFTMKGKKVLWMLMAGLALYACREKYVPNINEPETGYLVVDGFLNSGAGATTLFLSRTTKLSAAAAVVRERNAVVEVIGPTGTFRFTEVSPGIYSHPQLVLDPTQTYHVQIRTSNGKVYESTPSRVRKTPDYDSVYWRQENGGVQIYATAHDNATPVGYYQFRYEDTWEFHSKYTSSLKVYYNSRGTALNVGFRDSITRQDDLSIWKCWKTDTATRIMIASTAKLTQNVVSAFPLVFIPSGSVKLDVRYSINVHLYSISPEAYAFQEQLKKNTETIGSIFDGQPSDNFGNIRCITDPKEPVMGFIEVTEDRTKRIFIDKTQIPNWVYNNSCAAEVKIANNQVDLTAKDFFAATHIADSAGGKIDSAWFAPATCVDCTLTGTNKKPSFW